ncbi:MAG: cupredoxin domain-containing protein [Actinomycetota bacterium]
MRRPLLALVCATFAALLAAGCASSPASSPKASGASNATSPAVTPPIPVTGTVIDHANVDDTTRGSSLSVVIDASDNYFNPTFIKATPGARVSITVDDVGKNPHTFTIAGTSINLQLSPGQSQITEVTLPMTGSLPFYCTYHQVLGMRGAFYVS